MVLKGSFFFFFKLEFYYHFIDQITLSFDKLLTNKGKNTNAQGLLNLFMITSFVSIKNGSECLEMFWATPDRRNILIS